MSFFGQKFAIMDSILKNFCTIASCLKGTEVLMSKPGDLEQQPPRKKSKTMKFPQNSFFSS